MPQTSKVARSDLGHLCISEETAFAETPSSPAARRILFTGETLAEKGDSVSSKIVLSDRLVEDVTRVSRKVEGKITSEFRIGNCEHFLEGAFAVDVGDGTPVPVGLDATRFTMAAATQKVTRLSGSWLLDGFTVGQKVRVRGCTNPANNGVWVVASVTATELELGSGTAALVDETCPATAVVVGLQGNTTVNVNLSTSSVDNSINRASGSFVGDGFKVGQWFMAYGFSNAANAGPHRIISVAATKIIVDSGISTLVTEAAASGRAIHGTMYRQGTELKSYYIEINLTDVPGGFVQGFVGCRITGLSLSVKSGELVTLEATVMGSKGPSATATATGSIAPAPASELSPSMAAGIGVGNLLVDNAPDSNFNLSEMTIELNNNAESVAVITQDSPFEIVFGKSTVTGTDSVLFASRALFLRYENQTDMSKSVQITNPHGDLFMVTVPRQKTPGGMDVVLESENKTIVVAADFVGVKDPVTGCSLQIDRLIA